MSLDPTQPESLPASPEEPRISRSSPGDADREDPADPPAPLAWPGDWPIFALAMVYVLGLMLGLVVGAPGALVFVALVGVLVLDWRGYFSLRGLVVRPRSRVVRVLLGVLWVLFGVALLLIYFVRRFLGQPQEALPHPEATPLA
jgi:hypothetical protein